MKTRNDLETDDRVQHLQPRPGQRSEFKTNRVGPDLSAPILKTCGRCEREQLLTSYHLSSDNPNLRKNICITCEKEVMAEMATRGIKPQKVMVLDNPPVCLAEVRKTAP